MKNGWINIGGLYDWEKKKNFEIENEPQNIQLFNYSNI